MKTVNEKKMRHALGKGGGRNNGQWRRELKREARLRFWTAIAEQFCGANDTESYANAQRHIDRLKARAA